MGLGSSRLSQTIYADRKSIIMREKEREMRDDLLPWILVKLLTTKNLIKLFLFFFKLIFL
jgi:hypothetical protein